MTDFAKGSAVWATAKIGKATLSEMGSFGLGDASDPRIAHKWAPASEWLGYVRAKGFLKIVLVRQGVRRQE